ncbi:MAG: SUMF1/EgtB/PvdO family nonheme iron enzyme [Anaerolineales bacterium]|nr:MAG: SUMF1/EgtB/PvdO family nonheme iron enzyme [Anaerolineales bacterium]
MPTRQQSLISCLFAVVVGAGLVTVLAACMEQAPTQTLPVATVESVQTTAMGIEPIHPDMILVEAGSFEMGSAQGYDDEQPAHTVYVTRPFLISRHKVTFEEYDRFCDDTPGRMRLDDRGSGRGKRPVFGVTWYDAIAYCNLLSEKEGLTPCYSGKGKVTKCDFSASGYRLPTEAEWEYAAGGGPLGAGYLYAGSNEADEVAWYRENSNDMAHAVGLKKPNELGLFDMSGNGWEWCWDWYDEDYYASSPAEDPMGPASGRDRSRRASDWQQGADTLRVTFRSADTPSYRGSNGFRLVRTAAAD